MEGGVLKNTAEVEIVRDGILLVNMRAFLLVLVD
jgi:hypothetical protein